MLLEFVQKSLIIYMRRNTNFAAEHQPGLLKVYFEDCNPCSASLKDRSQTIHMLQAGYLATWTILDHTAKTLMKTKDSHDQQQDRLQGRQTKGTSQDIGKNIVALTDPMAILIDQDLAFVICEPIGKN